MGISRYKIYEPTYPHFLTCTVLHWLPIFTNTVKRGYVDEEYWRYSSARDYKGKNGLFEVEKLW